MRRLARARIGPKASRVNRVNAPTFVCTKFRKRPALKKEDAEKKLKSLGYGDVTDLALDEKGIWRGTAVRSGKK